MKKVLATLLSIAMVLGLMACGSSGDQIQTLVRGNIDAIYIGKTTDEYLKVVNSTTEQARDEYLDGLNTEAEFFCYYFGIISSTYAETYDDVKEETKAKIVDMYKQIYDKSKYEVKESVKQSDGNYTVQVLIDPIDIMETAVDMLSDGTYEPYENFVAKYDDMDTSEMSDAELDELVSEYNDELANVIVDLIISILPDLGYKDSKSLSVQVQKDDDGFYVINSDDWSKIDDYMIYYP